MGARDARQAPQELWITGDPDADHLLTVNGNALLVGMTLDQQNPMEKAFAGLYVIATRMGGTFDVPAIAALDVDARDRRAARLRRPEGFDHGRAARQAVGRTARGLARGGRRLRERGGVPVRARQGPRGRGVGTHPTGCGDRAPRRGSLDG